MQESLAAQGDENPATTVDEIGCVDTHELCPQLSSNLAPGPPL